MDIRQVYEAVRARVVGRERETQLILAALEAGRDLLLEGPPGTSKSTILRAICAAEGLSFHFIEGNADLTPTKLLGHHSPADVMRDGYTSENFVEGPLPRAMREGGMLYLEELNRVPEDTLNTLISAMAERELAVPRVGTVRAAPGFRVISAMNPFDNVGTARLSGALTDRLCRIRTGYQGAAEERRIVAQKTGRPADDELVVVAVEVARRSREHSDLRMGASIRAAIDFALVAGRMQGFAGAAEGPWANDGPDEALVAAAKVAFSIKVAVREASRRTDDDVVEEIVRDVLRERRLNPPPEGGAPDDGELPGPSTAPESAADAAGRDDDRARLLRNAPGANRDRPHADAFSPADASNIAGQLFLGDDVAGSSAARSRGERRFHKVAAEHPELADRIDRPGVSPADLADALEDQGDDALEVLGKLVSLGDRADLRALARRVATELVVDEARRNAAGRSARGRLVTGRFRDGLIDLDLERTLEQVAGDPFPRDEDFFVQERRRHERSYVLVLDVSGSMKGAKVFHGALALASVAVRLRRDPLAVVAFWRDAAVLKRLDEPLELDGLIDRLLGLSGHGLTNLGLGLRAALDELAGATTEEREGILFSDGLHTAGDPPGPLAAAFSTLHVVGTGEGDDSRRRCAELASLGHGRCAFVARPWEIAPALNACLSR